MHIYDSFDDCWRDYFAGQAHAAGFDSWITARFTHVDDEQYRQQQIAGSDTLGYQPTMLTLADPVKQQQTECVIKGLNTEVCNGLRRHFQDRFIEQLPARFGLFHSDKRQADAIYDSWESFAQAWLMREGRNLLAFNLPLLFDHVSDVQYWAWRQKGFDPCGTQRLVVTVFQYRTGRFAEVFITGVDDAEMARIRLLVQSRLSLQARELF